ncbi:hypothetical protein M9Y10_020674 [Tritrichomonas musculus]|uniref:Uncharacterized protein n=1 Tax=Tritrichomonas musculus TaxID=1915356 RepID=A0ABR2HEB1_9EUKA
MRHRLYYTTAAVNEKNVKTTGNSTINGILKVETTFPTGIYITNSQVNNNDIVGINFEKGAAEANMISLSYQEPAIGDIFYSQLISFCFGRKNFIFFIISTI